MKKAFGKWLMDIAKYITTAVIISSIFGGIESQWMIYLGSVAATLLTLIFGLLLQKDNKK